MKPRFATRRWAWCGLTAALLTLGLCACGSESSPVAGDAAGHAGTSDVGGAAGIAADSAASTGGTRIVGGAGGRGSNDDASVGQGGSAAGAGDKDGEGGALGGSERDGSAEAAGDGTAHVRDAASERASEASPSVPEAGSDDTVDVFLIGGQSNATGQGYAKNLPSAFVVNTKVQLYHSARIISGAQANTWIPLRHASEAPDAAGERFGPELGFGNAIQAAYPARKIAIIKHATSNTNLVTQWAPGSGPMDASRFGPEFKTFVDTVDGGLKALRARGVIPVIRGMLWQQGEADADLGGAASQQYGEHLRAFIARVREQWGAPSMLFVYGYVYPKSNFGASRDQVRQGEANVDQDSGHALAVPGAFVVKTDDLSLRANDPGTPYPSDLIHFGTAGQLELGARMATKIREKSPPP